MTADEIHSIGLAEVQLINVLQQVVIDETSNITGTTNRTEFTQFLLTDPRFFFYNRNGLFNVCS